MLNAFANFWSEHRVLYNRKKENGTYTEAEKRFLKIIEHYQRKRKEWKKDTYKA